MANSRNVKAKKYNFEIVEAGKPGVFYRTKTQRYAKRRAQGIANFTRTTILVFDIRGSERLLDSVIYPKAR